VRAAYIDTSCLVALAFGEREAEAMVSRVQGFDWLVASNLLEAELKAAFLREGAPEDAAPLNGITWLLPDRPLSREIDIVLTAGYLRGADLWHVACALYLAGGSTHELPFLTLDARQLAVARELGFPTE